MKQNILIGALVLVIANLLFLNYHFYMESQKVPDVVVPPPVETVSDSITVPETVPDVEAELTAFEAKLDKKLTEATQNLSALIHDQTLHSAGSDYGAGGRRSGVVALPDSVAQAKHWVGGQTSFGVSHIFAVKGDKCPSGSNIVDLPEHRQVAEEGFVYCFYWKDTLIFNKKDIDQCPPDMRPVEAKRGTPRRSDEFFCRLPGADELAKQRAELEAKQKEATTQSQPAPESEKAAEEAETTP